MYEFDNVVTAPLHGFRDTDDYWTSATTRPLLPRITVPTLVLNARNDPFLPARVLPARHEVSAAVELDQPEHGGHVGFMTGPFPGRIDWLSRRVFGYLEAPLRRSWMTSSSRRLAKWPNVPHCTGWLLLDRRGNWRMRDDAAQAARRFPANRSATRRCSVSSTATTTPMPRPVVFPERPAARVRGTGLYAVDRAAERN